MHRHALSLHRAVSPPLGVIAVALVLACAGAGLAAADKLTEDTMTKKDFDQITDVQTSEVGKPTATTVNVHNFDAAGEKAVTDAHGAKVVKGKEWKGLTPTERDKRLKALKKGLYDNIVFLIEVPSGNIWAVPDVDVTRMVTDKSIKRWTGEEEAKLPAAVKRDPSPSHSDRNGTRLERAIRDLDD